jgi:hypothetical protein
MDAVTIFRVFATKMLAFLVHQVVLPSPIVAKLQYAHPEPGN